jgi:hypothetical protein
VARFVSIAVLIIAGVIVADIITHPAGTAAASSGLASIEKKNFNSLLTGQ